MINSLQNFLDNLRIETLIIVTFAYLLILWILVPTWVYLDSKKKFNNPYLPVLFFFLILPLNIPGLIFYIIIRPDESDDMEGSSIDDHILHVPIVKFLDKSNDFVMSFDLRINGKVIDKEKRSNLNMNLSIDPDESSVTVIEELAEKKEEPSAKIELGKKQKDHKGSISKLKHNFTATMREVKGFFIIEEEDDENEVPEAPKTEHKKHKKKKRK